YRADARCGTSFAAAGRLRAPARRGRIRCTEIKRPRRFAASARLETMDRSQQCADRERRRTWENINMRTLGEDGRCALRRVTSNQHRRLTDRRIHHVQKRRRRDGRWLANPIPHSIENLYEEILAPAFKRDQKETGMFAPWCCGPGGGRVKARHTDKPGIGCER